MSWDELRGGATLQETADTLEIGTRERARQIEVQALGKLRLALLRAELRTLPPESPAYWEIVVKMQQARARMVVHPLAADRAPGSAPYEDGA